MMMLMCVYCIVYSYFKQRKVADDLPAMLQSLHQEKIDKTFAHIG